MGRNSYSKNLEGHALRHVGVMKTVVKEVIERKRSRDRMQLEHMKQTVQWYGKEQLQ